MPCGVAKAGGDSWREHGFELGAVFGAQCDVKGGYVLFQPCPPLRAWNRDDVVASGEEPGERDLGRACVFGFGHPVEHAQKRQVLVDIFLGVTRMVAPAVILGQDRKIPDRA